MKNRLYIFLILTISWMFPSFARIEQLVQDLSLETIYSYYAGLTPEVCDIGEHMHLLKHLAEECPHVTEIGISPVVSTWALLEGLTKNPAPVRTYVGIDTASPSQDYVLARKIAREKGLRFFFRKGSVLSLDIDPTDLLFIDSMHTYCHLTYELETFSSKARKYIALHDTSEPWGDREDDQYAGDYSEYPQQYDRSKRGLWPAVEDFLKNHPEWTLHARYFNCHGFTILRRVSE